MTSPSLKSKHDRLLRIKKIYHELRELGAVGAAEKLKAETEREDRAVAGELLYLDEHGQRPVRVVFHQGDQIFYIPAPIDMDHKHQGNLYNEDGDRPYYIEW